MPVDRIVLEVERVEQIGDRPAIDPDARVDLLAAVAARIAERELPGHVDRDASRVITAAADIRVGVLDDDVAFGVAPGDVEGAHLAAAEVTFDARTAEGAGEHAVELAGAVHLDGSCGRAERRHQPGQKAIALLPVRRWSRETASATRSPPNVGRPLKVTNVSSVATSPDVEADGVAVERIGQARRQAARARSACDC